MHCLSCLSYFNLKSLKTSYCEVHKANQENSEFDEMRSAIHLGLISSIKFAVQTLHSLTHRAGPTKFSVGIRSIGLVKTR